MKPVFSVEERQETRNDASAQQQQLFLHLFVSKKDEFIFIPPICALCRQRYVLGTDENLVK